MAKREDIETAIWSDPDFLALSGPARAVYVWSFTNQRSGMSGIYVVAQDSMSLETGFTGRRLDAALAELQEKRFIFYDGRVMFVRTKTRRARNRSTNIAKSIASDVESLGAHPFVALWWQENANQGWVTDLMVKPENIGDSEGSSQPPTGPLVGAHGCGYVYVNEGERGLGREDQESTPVAELPAGFPAELTAHLDMVETVLGDLAARHEAKAVSRLSLASVFAANPQKAFVAEAHRFVSWADDQPKKRRDVVAGYRQWMSRTSDLAVIEPLTSSGAITGSPGRPMSEKDARSARRLAAFNRLTGQGEAA